MPELLPEFRETPLSVGYGRSFYPESASVETALPITVAGGEHRDVEIVLHKRKQSRLRGTVNIVGDIRRELLVSMAIVQRGTGTVIGGGSIARAREFYVEPMPEGEFLISLTATGRAGAQFFGKALVRVNAHDTAEVKLTMQPGITVRGVLRFEDDGTVLPGGVGLELVSADGAPGTPLKADVGEKGLFRIDHVALGEYHVRLTGLPAGYAPMRRNVTVASGDLNVVITNKLGRITGKTTPGSRVVLRVEGEEDGWSNQIITADQEGVFTFANLAPGRYRVQGRSVEVEAGQTAEAK